MKKAILLSTIVAGFAIGAFAGPGPSYQGQSVVNTVPTVAVKADCPYILSQPVNGKGAAYAQSCNAETVKASKLCREHCQ